MNIIPTEVDNWWKQCEGEIEQHDGVIYYAISEQQLAEFMKKALGNSIRAGIELAKQAMLHGVNNIGTGANNGS